MKKILLLLSFFIAQGIHAQMENVFPNEDAYWSLRSSTGDAMSGEIWETWGVQY